MVKRSKNILSTFFFLFPGIAVIYLFILLTGLLGGGSLFLFALFLYWGPLGLAHLGLSPAGSLCFDAGLSLIFFVQHSVMLRTPFRQKLGLLLPEKYHGALFTLTSGMLLLAVVILWQGVDYQLVTLTGGLRWLARLIFFLAAAGFFWGVLALGFHDPFGLAPLVADRRSQPEPPQDLVVSGPYRWVRHPLYLCTILFIWSSPDLSADRLLFNILWTVWIMIGARLEEQDLIDAFGQAYLDYQQQVPRLLPFFPPPAPKPN
jgi:protein-S-isoprenylcysteine O-methyltransferase Ste14